MPGSPRRFFPISMLVDETGRVDVIGIDRIARFTPAGRADDAFGVGGEVRFPAGPYGFPKALAQPDGGLLLFTAPSYDGEPDGQPLFSVRAFGSTGRPLGAGAQAFPIDPRLGGGTASLGMSTRLGAGPDQGSFTPRAAVRRPDGSIVLVGGARVLQYPDTPGRDGVAAALFAAVALTPELGPDGSFGGAATRARFSLRVARQHARGSARARRILMRVRASGPGLALLRVRDGRRRILAQQVVPIFASGGTTVRLPLTVTGRRVLRSGGRRVIVSYRFVDVVRERATGVGRARLR